MVFSSLIFVFIFLPLTLGIYYLAPSSLKNFIIFIASLIFYAWGEPVYIVVMLFTILCNYSASLLLDKYRTHQTRARGILIATMFIDLGILSYYKYGAFLLENLNKIWSLDLEVVSLALPVGISFYTFQTMSYVIDVYKDKVPVQRNIISFGTYIAMFPQLIAGPIVKYSQIYKQLEKRKESLKMLGQGVELFILGLAKKVLLANNVGILWQTVKTQGGGELSALSAWLGIIAFTLQIYFDFSGYSDMALGLGKMFGFNLTKNFNYPYIAQSVTDFWRRWHISLGTWFREYVYIPLGGNKEGQLKQLRNLLIVWFLTGLWHGASWNFVLWGLYFGIFVTAEKLLLRNWLTKAPRLAGHLYTLLVVIVGWVFFEFTDMGQAFNFLQAMFGGGSSPLLDSKGLYYLNTYGLFLLVGALCSTPFPKRFAQVLYHKKLKTPRGLLVPLTYLLLVFLCTSYLVNESYNPFLYFRF